MNSSRWTPAYVGLGSNLAQPRLQVERGFAALGQLPDTVFVARSRLYRSRPMGPQGQPDFVNAVAGLLTRLQPEPLLAKLKSLEAELGREQPVQRWGPRIIDFDLLLYGDVSMTGPPLTLPHPGLLERNWVLWPLADIAPTLKIPGNGRAAQLAAALGTAGLEPLTATVGEGAQS